MSSNETAKPSPKALPPKAKSGVSLIRWVWYLLILLALLALFAGAWWGHQQLQGLQALNQQQKDLIKQQQSQLERLNSTPNQLAVVNEQLASLAKQVNQNAQRLAALPGSDRQDWLIAEVEYLLRIANQRNQLERNSTESLALLSAADAVLKEMDNPGLLDVRKQLAKEQLQLKQQGTVDVDGIYLKLASLQESVENLEWVPQLPYQSDFSEQGRSLEPTQSPSDQATNTDATSEDDVSFWQKVKNQFSTLIVVNERQGPVEAPLSPQQHYYLKQNLRLMFEQAQMALLKEDQRLYELSLQKADNWLNKYFQNNQRNTKAMIETLIELKSLSIVPQQVDISGSLELLKDYMWQNRFQPIKNRQEDSKSNDSETSS